MGFINIQGGNKTKSKSKRFGKKIIATTLSGSNQMFGKVLKNCGNHFKIKCSDGIVRSAPLTSTVRKKCPKLLEGSFVLIETTDMEYCTILSGANPTSDVEEIFNNDEDDTGCVFSKNNDEFKDLINAQNEGNLEENINIKKKSGSKSDSKVKIRTQSQNDYSNVIIMGDNNDDYEYEEEEVEVDKFGNTIEKNKEDVKNDSGNLNTEPEKVNKSTKSEKVNKSTKSEKVNKSNKSKDSNNQVLKVGFNESDDDEVDDVDDL
jgi:translation initiation factor IF-1